MGRFYIVRRITVPEERNVDTFEEFMRDEYLPAIHKGPTRVGQATSLSLHRRASRLIEGSDQFLLVAEYSGLKDLIKVVVDDNEVQQKFEAFNARVEDLGPFDEAALDAQLEDFGPSSEVAAWRRTSASELEEGE